MKEEDRALLIRYRLEQAHAALGDAQCLLAANRTPQGIINRAYYAMFYAVLALLQTIDRIPSKHAGAISMFDTDFVRKEAFPRELSKDLHRAFELRQTADYRASPRISLDDATMMVEKAGLFVQAIASYLTEEQERRL
jgi:uncharacterized protein